MENRENLKKITITKIRKTSNTPKVHSAKTPKKVKRIKKSPSAASRFLRRMIIPRPDVLHTYLQHSDINLYLEYLERHYAAFVKVHTLGKTYEHRPLKAIEIDWHSPRNASGNVADGFPQRRRLKSAPTNKGGALNTPTDSNLELSPVRNMVFIEGGTHAREWISISVALNCIHQLTEKNMRNRELLRKLRFFIVPVTNPDGYEYTRQKNRRWRKNRRPIGNRKIIGTDCNRNYDFHWENGTSRMARNTYKGDKPFSEPETRAIRNALCKLAPQLLFFLSLHSYAQSIMYPWGYSKELPESWMKLQTLALSGRNAIKTYNGRIYRTGSIANLSKRTITGSIVDYAFGVIKVPLALVMELPSQEFGFQPPAEAISPIGHESWFGIRQMCKVAYDLLPTLQPLPSHEPQHSEITSTIDVSQTFEIERVQETDDIVSKNERLNVALFNSLSHKTAAVDADCNTPLLRSICAAPTIIKCNS